jgi:hypothetical protein
MPSIPTDENIYTSLSALRRFQFRSKGFDFHPLQPINSLLNGRHASRLRGRGLNFEEMRNYQLGDDIRTMDWKVTMRTGKPHVKIYSEERERNVYLLIDQRSSMFFGSTGKMKSVIAAEISALIAWNVVSKTDRIGAIVFNDSKAVTIAAQRSQNQVIKILNEVVEQNQELKVGKVESPVSESIDMVFERLQRVIGHDALAILVSDGYGINARCGERIKNICRNNELIVCHVTDPLELQLSKLSQLVVSDGEMQLDVVASNELTRTKFKQDAQQDIDRFNQIAKKYRIPVLPFNTLDESDKQLRLALGV